MKAIILKTKPISVNTLYRGRRFITSEGKSTKALMAYEAKKQWKNKPLKCNISIDIDFHVPNCKSDLDNLLKATLDCLTGVIWVDDRQITQILANKYIDKKTPRIELLINELEDLK